MHINDRTKGWEQCIAESMLLGMHYAFVTHIYFTAHSKDRLDAETLEIVPKDDIDKRGKEFYSIFKDEQFKRDSRLALQYLKDYGPQP